MSDTPLPQQSQIQTNAGIQTPTIKIKHYPVWLIILLLLIFAPLEADRLHKIYHRIN